MKSYTFTGNWTDIDADKMHTSMMELGRARLVVPDFNQWTFYAHGSDFLAWRQSWGMYSSLSADTVEGLVEKVEGYYRRLDGPPEP